MKYLRYRSYSKTFIKVLANQEDLQVLKDLIIEREELLKNESLNTI